MHITSVGYSPYRTMNSYKMNFRGEEPQEEPQETTHKKAPEGLTPEEIAKKEKIRTAIKNQIIGASAATALLLGGFFGAKEIDKHIERNQDIISIDLLESTDAEDVANVLGMSTDLIFSKEITNENGEKIQRVYYPKEFDYLSEVKEDAIDDFIKKQSNDRYSVIKKLDEKRAYQKEISTAGIDDDGNVYVKIFPHDNQKDSEITIDKFAALYDINPEALLEYNDFIRVGDYTTGLISSETNSNILKAGTVLVFSQDEVDTKNINFEYK